MAAAGGTFLAIPRGFAPRTRVPRIGVTGVKLDLLSTVVLTSDMPALADVEDTVFGEMFDDRVQAVAWPGSVVCLEFGYYVDPGMSMEINSLLIPNNFSFGGLFDQGPGA